MRLSLTPQSQYHTSSSLGRSAVFRPDGSLATFSVIVSIGSFVVAAVFSRCDSLGIFVIVRSIGSLVGYAVSLHCRQITRRLDSSSASTAIAPKSNAS